jgi:hypothetical protein
MDGGVVAGFIALLTRAAFFASTVGLFDPAPPARMVLIMPSDNSSL